MRLKPGKLYKVIHPDVLFRVANNDKLRSRRVSYREDCLVLFLEKGEHVHEMSKGNRFAFTPYYFLLGETKVELREHDFFGNIKFHRYFEEVKETLL